VRACHGNGAPASEAAHPFRGLARTFFLAVSPTARRVREVSCRWLRQPFPSSRMFGFGAVWVTRKRGF